MYCSSFLDSVPLDNIFRQLGIDPHSIQASHSGGPPPTGNFVILTSHLFRIFREYEHNEILITNTNVFLNAIILI